MSRKIDEELCPTRVGGLVARHGERPTPILEPVIGFQWNAGPRHLPAAIGAIGARLGPIKPGTTR